MSHWDSSLLAAEAEAKETASVLFFVIDSATRAISSMIEVAELIASGRNVVLVINNITDGQVGGAARAAPAGCCATLTRARRMCRGSGCPGGSWRT